MLWLASAPFQSAVTGFLAFVLLPHDGAAMVDAARKEAVALSDVRELRRYTATDHKAFDQSLKHCPAGAFCRNCMPINDTADHCWAVKTPILYKIKSYGKIESKNKAAIVRSPITPCTLQRPCPEPCLSQSLQLSVDTKHSGSAVWLAHALLSSYDADMIV